MKCYYEVLEIPRDADDGEIKVAYRKLALKWHPDKNLDNELEAKEQFQLVQQAYEVLSDRQERAWYDNHREQILRGSDTDFQDDSLNVFPYFTTQCFKGYGDDDGGFYAVYRKLFEKLVEEDIKFMDSKSDLEEIPSFGFSNSDYEDIVGPFYAYWMSYTTKKSYVWLDPYNIKEVRDRRMLKLVEKENKKVRQKAKKERNEEIRNLVAFVRKRDKRVQAYSKMLEDKAIKNREKQKELRKQKLLERKKELHDTSQEAEWSKFDNVKQELKDIDKYLTEQFGETVSDSDDETQEDNLYCVACNKVFKTPKAFENHESSKKHKDNVARLKVEMGEEDDDDDDDVEDIDSEEYENENSHSFEIINGADCVDDINDPDAVKELSNDDDDIDNDESESVENAKLSTKKKGKKNKKVIRLKQESVSEISDIDIVPEILSNNEDFEEISKKSNKKQKNKAQTKKSEPTDSIPKPVIDKDIHIGDTNSNRKGSKKNKNAQETTEVNVSLCCVTCKSNFPSKNKLFEHLKKTGHSVALPDKPKTKKKSAK